MPLLLRFPDTTMQSNPASVSRNTRKPFWIAIAVALAIAIAAVAYFSLFAKKSAPDVTFSSLNGEQISMESLRGNVVLVNFWATSCVTCIKEMPQLVETYDKYKEQGLRTIAVAMSYDPPNYVINYAKTRGLPFTVALDTQGKVAHSFDEVKLTPTTYVVDKNGHIIKRYVGEPDFAALHQLIEKALAA